MSDPAWRSRLEGAVEDHRAGRLEAAEAGYRAALALAPAHPDTLHLLGVLCHQRDRSDEAVDLIGRAIALDGNVADFHSNLGVCLKALGRTADAVGAFRDALRLRPDFPAAACNLGDALATLGLFGEAIAWHRRAVAAEPDNAEFRYNFANALKDAGDSDAAIAEYERALALRPGYAEAHNNLGRALFDDGRLDVAEIQLQQALVRQPGNAEAHYNLGKLRHVQGRFADEMACYRQALALRPDFAAAHDNLLMVMNYDPAITTDALAKAHRAFGRRYAGLAAWAPHGNRRMPDRRLRIGYVSADLCRHPVGFFVQAAFARHDRQSFEIVAYDCGERHDTVTQALRDHAAVWRPVRHLDDAQLAAQVRTDGIDILVDLAGHTGGNRLLAFARKPAPVQVSWIGYFFTTGLGAIDAALMDEATVLPGGERWFSEEVIRLPGSRFCYTPPPYAPAPAPPPVLRNGYVTFGSFNSLAKLSGDVAALWARVLAAVPAARLVVKWATLAHDAERRRIAALFAAAGLDAARLDLRAASPHPAMLHEYGDIDIALDPFPFSGGLTSMEALWMGVPVVTWPGERPVSRQTLGLLRAIGLDGLVAGSADDYVARARDLAADVAQLSALRAALRSRIAASPLLDHAGHVRHLEAAYRGLWRRWCARDG